MIRLEPLVEDDEHAVEGRAPAGLLPPGVSPHRDTAAVLAREVEQYVLVAQPQEPRCSLGGQRLAALGRANNPEGGVMLALQAMLPGDRREYD